MIYAVVLLMLLIDGCASGRVPSYEETIFNAVAQRLPQPGTHVLVYEVHSGPPGMSSYETEAVTWLLQRGLVVVERSGIDRILNEQRFTLGNSEASVLRAGHLIGAAEVVFIQSWGNGVNLRSVEVESGRILWSVGGSYQYHCTSTSQWSGFQYHCYPQNLIRPALDRVWASHQVAAESH
jgi:hypothetical protein